MVLNLFTYKVTYVVVHTLYEYLEFLYYTFLYYYQIFLNIYHKYTKIEDSHYIAEHVKIINRIPKHLSIILGNEEPSYTDLAKLVAWCIASGITYISFYDHKGILKKSQEKLQKAVDAKKTTNTHIIWNQGEEGYKNGFSGRKVFLRTFSLSDSRSIIVDAAKKLCEVKSGDISLESVDKNLKDRYLFPDPDLCLYCGNIFTLYGYPPWEVRLTEFIGIGSHHNMNPRTLIRALYRFSKIEMRLGR